MENLVLLLVFGYLDVYLDICCSFIARRVHGKFYELNLKKGYGCPGKHALDLSIVKPKTKGKKLNADATCVVNSHQGKATGVLF